ncbi:MAG: DUF4867 family protein [Firmicutes bacterium]|nr:DUF4867 family protein [Bacillota bacterium]
MLAKLKELNPELEIYSIKDEKFKQYGKIIDIDTNEIVSACEKLEFPKKNSQYKPSVKALEELLCAEKFHELLFGGCDAQIGICSGYNRLMNALEYHKSSEINVAVTPLVLLLGLEYEMEGTEYSSDNIKAFYLEKGEAVEIFSTSLHFCPCQVADEGFSCVVVLPKNTNTPLDKASDDRLLFAKNKWLICHDKNDALINRGVYPGIHGKNYEIKY